MLDKIWNKETHGAVRIVIEKTANISEGDLNEQDVKKIGRSASISDRGIVDLLDNKLRRDVLVSFHRIFAKGKKTLKRGATLNSSSNSNNKQQGQQQQSSQQHPEYVDAAYSLGRWSIGRFRRIIAELREPATRFKPRGTLLEDLESFQWAVASFNAAQSLQETHPDDEDASLKDMRDVQADAKVWERYGLGVKGLEGSIPDLTSDESIDFSSLRQEALDYYRDRIYKTFEELTDGEDFVKALHVLPRYKIGGIIFQMVLPLLRKLFPEDMLKDEVIPLYAVLIVTQPGQRNSAQQLETLLEIANDLITENAVCSVLEYCSHTQKSDCARVVVDAVPEKVTSEGIVTALLPVCMRGADQYLAMMELFVMDKATTARLEDPNQDDMTEELGVESSNHAKSMNKSSIISKHQNGVKGETAREFVEFVAKSFYLLAFLASVGGYAKPGTLTELMEFYNDPCAYFLTSFVTEKQHKEFIAEAFHSVCALNFSSIAWAMVQKGWVPNNINRELEEAVTLGHQNIVHLLLEYLLIPDDKMHGSGLPLVFRKSEALALLPRVASRFPKEAAWFLEQLSCIPLPACVPRGRHAEPEVRPRPVKGVRLGTLNLNDCVYHRKEAGGTAVQVWPRLVMNGQLRQAGSGKDDFEAESIICLAPEAFLTGNAVHNPLFGKTWSPSTSPFIRLLAEENDQIILQPVMRALMEYHWSRGKFWLRFAFQFITTAVYVALLAIMFFIVGRHQMERLHDDSFLKTIGVVVTILASFFLFQEIREFHDYPKHYLHSASNLVDTGIHFTALYVSVGAIYFRTYVEPVIMGLTLILCGIRVIFHLRILPSVGPLVRLWVTASVNILPILIPWGFMALSFAGAFYLVQYQAAIEANSVTKNFDTYTRSLQTVLTMATHDYAYVFNLSNFLSLC
jgi:hypothetical protein